MIIQVPPQTTAVTDDSGMKDDEANVLNVRSLLQHLDAVRAATKLSVELFDT